MGHVAGALTDEICDIEGFLDSLLGVRSRADNYRAVLRRDPCAFCGHRRKRMTIDHIEPIARGGQKRLDESDRSLLRLQCLQEDD